MGIYISLPCQFPALEEYGSNFHFVGFTAFGHVPILLDSRNLTKGRVRAHFMHDRKSRKTGATGLIFPQSCEFFKPVCSPRNILPLNDILWYSYSMKIEDLKGIVHSDPEIMGGTPVFMGTRVPLQNLIDYLEGGESIEDFLDGFPGVKREHVIGVIEAAKLKMLETV